MVLFVAVSAWGQAGRPISISGRVVDVLTGQGIADAVVEARPAIQTAQGYSFGAAESQPVRTARTAADGSFQMGVPFGPYTLSATKTGYLQGSPGNPVSFVPGEGKVSMKVELSLEKPAEVAGILIEKESGKPLPNLMVRLVSLKAANGVFLPVHQGSTASSPSGQFTLKVRPGSYVLMVQPKRLSTLQVVEADYRGEDSEVPLLRYTAEELSTAPLLYVHAGQTLDLGAVEIARQRVASLVVRAGEGCASTNEIELRVSEGVAVPDIDVFEPVAAGMVACGRTVAIPALPRGRYHVSAWMEGAPPRSGSRAVDMESSSQHVWLPLTPLSEVRFQVRPGDDVPADVWKQIDWKKARLALWETSENHPKARPEMVKVTETGSARLRVGGSLWRVNLMGIPALVTSGVAYNGVPQREFSFEVNPSAPVHNVDIYLSKSASGIAGTVVQKDGRLATAATVMIVRLPADPRNAHWSRKVVPCDPMGRFAFAPLPKGEYGVLAVSEATLSRLHLPGALERALTLATRVEVREGISALAALSLIPE